MVKQAYINYSLGLRRAVVLASTLHGHQSNDSGLPIGFGAGAMT